MDNNNDKSGIVDKDDDKYENNSFQDNNVQEDNNIQLNNNIQQDNNTSDIYQSDKENKEKQINYFREVMEMIIYFIVVVISVILIHQFVGQQIQVSGSSMESTLHNEDHLILEKISYEVGDPQRFDIVVFRPYQEDKDTYYIKRVIGMPGDTIQIIGSDIYINGEILDEHYGNEPILDGGLATDAITLGQDEYFLMGDNRNNSKDSRDTSIGAVKRAAIIGRAWVRIWPLKEFGILEHQ